jgi:hypothetical protein
MRYELRHGESHVEGIVYDLRMRAASAEQQLTALPAAGST